MSVYACTGQCLMIEPVDLSAFSATPPPQIYVPHPQRLVKLPRTMMRSWVARHLKTVQNGLCPLCGKTIDLTIKGEGVVDHDHDTGQIRGVLHRSCNAAEGKISNAAARWGCKSADYSEIIPYLERIVAYLKQPGTQFIYPMHKTADEKKDDRNRKVREARAATKAKLAMRGNRNV